MKIKQVFVRESLLKKMTMIERVIAKKIMTMAEVATPLVMKCLLNTRTTNTTDYIG
jgi:hypothetical protein